MGTFRYIGTAALIARAQDALEEAVTEAAHDLQERAKREAPVDDGTLRDSITVEGPERHGSQVVARVQTNVWYAGMVHEGTRPHEITPRRREALSVEGQAVEHVHHPGTRGYKFLEGPLLAQRAAYLAAIAAAARRRF